MSIAGGALTLLEIYLTERYQKVKIGSTESTALQVLSGVPQESVLGPLFINLFINYLPETIVSSCYGYADDYKVVGTNTVTLQKDTSKIWQWCSGNKMRLNLAKRRLLSITGEANVQLRTRFLEKPKFEKDLGIVVSSDLSWKTQAEKRFEKTMKVFWSLKRNIPKVSSWITRKNLYRSYAFPVILYGSSLWRASKADLRTIEIVQKKWFPGFYRKHNWSTRSACKDSQFFHWRCNVRLMFS